MTKEEKKLLINLIKSEIISIEFRMSEPFKEQDSKLKKSLDNYKQKLSNILNKLI